MNPEKKTSEVAQQNSLSDNFSPTRTESSDSGNNRKYKISFSIN